MRVYRDREATLAKMRARSARLRAADVEGYRAKQRERYANNKERISIQAAASYRRHRERRLENEKAARAANPERAALQLAKRVLARQAGVRIRDISDDVAAAKVLQLELVRLLKAGEMR